MANPVKGDVSWQVGDEEYTLVLDFNALCELETLTDEPSALTFQKVERGFASAVGLVVWAALQRHHAGIKVPEVRDLISEAGMESIQSTLVRLVAASTVTGEGEKKPGKPKRPTGTRS